MYKEICPSSKYCLHICNNIRCIKFFPLYYDSASWPKPVIRPVNYGNFNFLVVYKSI